VLSYHPHEPQRRARLLAENLGSHAVVAALMDIYGIDRARAESVVRSAIS
jgi:ribosomal protein S13